MKLKNRTFTGSTSDAVTKREQENREIARRAASEGFVLLKNDGHLLPLAAKGKIGLYGAGAVKTIKGAPAPAMSMSGTVFPFIRG